MENLDVSVQPELRIASRRGRASRQAAVSTIVAPRTRKVRSYALLNETALETIEGQADWILHNIGVEFRGDQDALDLFAAAGAHVYGERVTFEPGLARKLCSTAPSEFKRSCRKGGGNLKAA